MHETIGIIITARVNSRRMHQKALKKINGKYTIEILLDHVINDKYPVILAIPDTDIDDKLAKIAENKGVEVYKGQNDSPMHRLYECAKLNNFEHIVRITCDDILIDKILLFNQIKMHLNLKQKKSWDYTFMRRCPEGIAGEVIKFSALEKAIEGIGDDPVEFVSYYLKKQGFEVFEYYPPPEYQFSYRLTMDYEEDFMLLSILFASLNDGFGTLDALHFLHKNKSLLNINKLPQVTLYSCNYNQGKFIKDCIYSIELSDFWFDDFEYIIIDDCSTDNSMNIVMEHYSTLPVKIREKIKIYRNKENIGLPACCNKALDMARGKYIMRIDADDTIELQILPKMLDKMKIDNTQGCLSGYNETKSALSVTATITENPYHPGCALLSKFAVNEIKFKEDLEYLEGKEFFERFNKKYKVSFIDEPLWNYRKHKNSKTANSEHPDNMEEK